MCQDHHKFSVMLSPSNLILFTCFTLTPPARTWPLVVLCTQLCKIFRRYGLPSLFWKPPNDGGVVGIFHNTVLSMFGIAFMGVQRKQVGAEHRALGDPSVWCLWGSPIPSCRVWCSSSGCFPSFPISIFWCSYYFQVVWRRVNRKLTRQPIDSTHQLWRDKRVFISAVAAVLSVLPLHILVVFSDKAGQSAVGPRELQCRGRAGKLGQRKDRCWAKWRDKEMLTMTLAVCVFESVWLNFCWCRCKKLVH